MACCAFAAFLLTQLLIPVRWAMRHVSGEAPNHSVAWSPALAAAATVAAPARRFRRGFAIVFAAELCLFTGAAVAAGTAATDTATRNDLLSRMHHAICSVTGEAP